ncbi:MAG TPA: outer membrane protein assembly factor BamD [Terriglobales bacterium]|nr:outer membrane protein assembly factor BamD [Terriglobales bacterium]
MLRRFATFVLLAALIFAVACTNKKVNNPLANVGSKQPDKVLFDRAMDAMKHNRFDVSRMTLQTLINTYPDSEYIARAKLGVADSWYAEGGSASLTQAEIEYKDFITFFPNMPEAAEAQLKIANIHYQEMEKPDRDFTHARRAEDEYRQLILQWPDSKLVPDAKQHLMQVQEVIAEREFQVGSFYFKRQSFPAAIARLQTLMDRYPLYSKADEALYTLGQSYESEINLVRSHPGNEAAKARLIQMLTEKSSEAYSRIITRYPVMDRATDAKARLVAMNQPVPKTTKAALALNKAEADSRRESGTLASIMRGFQKHPDVAHASHVGDPTLVDPQEVSAVGVTQQATKAAVGSGSATGGTQNANAEVIGAGPPGPDQEAPRSDAPPAGNSQGVGVEILNGGSAGSSAAPPAAAPAPPAPADPNELKPTVEAADPNELKPTVAADSDQAAPPPAQVNEIQPGSADKSTSADAKPGDEPASDADVSSSKPKKKKGLKKVIPF